MNNKQSQSPHQNQQQQQRNVPNRSKSMNTSIAPTRKPSNQNVYNTRQNNNTNFSSNNSVGSNHSVHSRNQRPIRSGGGGDRSPKGGGGRSPVNNHRSSGGNSVGGGHRKAPDRSQSSSATISSHHNNQQNNNRHVKEIILYNTTGSGNNKKERQVIRLSAETFLSKRLMYLDAPPVRTEDDDINDDTDNRDDSNNTTNKNKNRNNIFQQQPYITKFWQPHQRCLWTSEVRIEAIENDTAKYLDYKPLQTNDDTRWKAKVMKDTDDDEVTTAHDEIIKSAILSILNKLSWTNLDKLTIQFLKAVGSSATAKEQQHQAVDYDNNSQCSEKSATSVHTVVLVMRLVVEKAMAEPHFAELYANLSVKLSQVHKAFKRSVLTICQEQFEVTERNEYNNTNDNSISESSDNNNLTNNSETTANTTTATITTMNKQASIGLMKFIGELYKVGIIKSSVMISCLNRLLILDDEEKLECFTKLITTIGSRLYQDKAIYHSEQMDHIWDIVYKLAGHTTNKQDNNQIIVAAPSIRLKFMLQSLIELKENNWIQIRHEAEKAKTIQEIHQDIAAEELEKASLTRNKSSSSCRSNRFNNNNNTKPLIKRSVSSDGCMYHYHASPQQQSNNTIARQSSSVSIASTDSSSFNIDLHNQDVLRMPNNHGTKSRPNRLRRAKSDDGQKLLNEYIKQQPNIINNNNNNSSPPSKIPNNNNNTNKKQSPKNRRNNPPSPPKRTKSNDTLDFTGFDNDNKPKRQGSISNLSVLTPNIDYQSSPKECGERSKAIFKEYFISDDKKETIKSIQELVGTNTYDSTSNIGIKMYSDRCVAMIESCILMVLEMKERDVYKFLDIIAACVNQEIIIIIENISTSSNNILIRSLNDPLEFLRDIEIDAPMASSYLSLIIASWIDCKYILSIGFLLLQVPDYFKTNGRPAEFAIQILYKLHTIQKKKQKKEDEENHNNNGDNNQSGVGGAAATGTTVTNQVVEDIAVVRHDQEFMIIENLMTESDKKINPSVRDFVKVILSKMIQS